MSALEAFHFLRPEWLLLVFPVGLITVLESRGNDQLRQWRPVIAGHLLNEMIIRSHSGRTLSPRLASRVVAVLMILAMAGPSWERGDSPFARDGAALVIAVDLSASMAERDVQPDRLQRARDKVRQLVKARGDSATALIAYAGTAHTVLPLSEDSGVLLYYLDALAVGMLPREGKSPGSVLPLARSMLAGLEDSATLLLVSDGAGNEASAAFASLADDTSIQLLVWGIGKTQAEIDSDAQRGLRSDAQPLQEEQLKAIASAAGGHYRRLTPHDEDVRDLSRRIERHYNTLGDSSRPWVDAGYYLVFPIMALFLLWFRRGWVLLRW